MAIYLACHAMDPEGPEGVRRAARRGWAGSEAGGLRASAWRAGPRGSWGERAPRGAAAGRAAMRAMVVAAVARLVEGVREVPQAEEASGSRRTVTARDSFDSNETSEWLRRHQGTCRRTLFRTIDALRKGRRVFGDNPAADDGARGVRRLRPSRNVAEASSPYVEAHGRAGRATEEAQSASRLGGAPAGADGEPPHPPFGHLLPGGEKGTSPHRAGDAWRTRERSPSPDGSDFWGKVDLTTHGRINPAPRLPPSPPV